MVSLLRQSGYTSSYVRGEINLTAAQIEQWLGISTENTCAVLNLLAQGQIPKSAVKSVLAGSCPGNSSPLISIRLRHVWVKVNIGGVNYFFDPSYKPHSFSNGINLAEASGHDIHSYLTSAKVGATITQDYVRGINRSNIRANLTEYASGLANHIRSNFPAATLADVVGGKTIIPHDGSILRQTTLPYQHLGTALTEWEEIPSNQRPTLRVRYRGIDKTFTSDAIYGKRFTITYNSSNQPVLRLDGITQATGNATPVGSVDNVTINITHSAYSQNFANQEIKQTITAGGTYHIGNGWGVARRGVIEFHRARLLEAKNSGAIDSSEAVLGASLAMISAAWIAQVNQSGYINDQLAKTNTTLHHQVGIAGYYQSAYVDLPGNVIGITSQHADTEIEEAAFFNSISASSILESVVVQQITGNSAVSTVKLIDMAVNNDYRIYDASAVNYTSVVKPGLTFCSDRLSVFENIINAGGRLILPQRCNLSENLWRGVGYFDIRFSQGSGGIGAIIDGGFLGGYSTSTQTPNQQVSNTQRNTISSNNSVQSSGQAFGDPIDMVHGHYLYARNDISTGIGGFPYGLKFERLYSSGLYAQPGPLGRGWTHNFSIENTVGSDGLQGLGESSALDAVGAIVENMVALDLYRDSSKPLDKLVIATIGQRWLGDQLINNTVIVRQGLNGEVFTKLPDGTYNPPPGNSAKLTRNAQGILSYETRNKARLDFNENGKIISYTQANGLRVNFTYSGNDLTQVSNSLGRTLTFSHASGRITQVADGSRNVKYVYDAQGNLTTFTDATSKNTTFQYDQPGRLVRLYYPSAPSTAFLTNVYDTLGRVRTQTNIHGKLYTYHFSGSRSEEVGPGNVSRVTYFNALGKAVKTIDPMGEVTLNSYDGQGRLTRTIHPEGNRVDYVYDDSPCSTQMHCSHNIKTITRVAKPGSLPGPLVTSFTYEPNFNKVASHTDPRGKVTSYTYNSHGNPHQIVYPADASGQHPVTTYGYTSFTPSGFPMFSLLSTETRKINPYSSVTTALTYNSSNKYAPATTVVDAGTGGLNLTTSHTYDGHGNLVQENGPRTDVGDVTSYVHDAERRVTQITDAMGKQTRFAFDADGRLIRTATQIGAQWLVTCRAHTLSGKPQRTWGPSLMASSTSCPAASAPTRVTDHAYDDLDRPIRLTERLTASEGGDRVTETAYRADDNIAEVRHGVGGALEQSTSYTYTRNGLVATIKDAKDNLTTYQYDGHDRHFKTRFPDKDLANSSSTTDFEQYGFDPNGNVIRLFKRDGRMISYTYDNLNRLLRQTHPHPANDIEYSYDLLGRPLTVDYVPYALPGATSMADRQAATVDHPVNKHNYNDFGIRANIQYHWDRAGRLLSTRIGHRAFEYEYDAAGNRVRMTWPEDGFHVTTSHDALNRPTAIRELGDTLLAGYVYDDLSRRATVSLGNGTVTSFGYGPAGTLASLSHDLAGTSHDVAWTYQRNQVQEIQGQSWSNDLYGWRAVTARARSYTVNGLNQYTSVDATPLSHDANGNLTGHGLLAYGYDTAGHLKTVSKAGALIATFGYDPVGRLHETRIFDETTQLLYDAADLVAEYDGNGTLLRRYVHGPGVDEPLVWYEGSGTNNKSWLYADHQGSVVAVANASGFPVNTYRYGPYGEVDLDIGIRFRYTGQQYLRQLGLYYYKARFYSANLGRFLQPDPIGTSDDLNLYAYVRNDPVNYTDPSGEFAVVGAIYGGIAGGVGGVITAGFSPNQTVGSTLKSLGLGVLAGAATGAVAPWLSNRAGTAAASLGLARGVGAVPVTAAIGGASSAVGQLAGNVVTGQPLGTNFSLGAAGGSAVGAPLAMLPAKLVGNVAATTVGTNVTWGSRSLTVVTPTVQHTGSTFRALTTGAIGGAFEAGGQAVESMFFPALSTGGASGGTK